MTGKFLFAAALAAVAAPAVAAVTVLGNSSARLCYEAAEARMVPTWESLGRCDLALKEETLTEDDRNATYVNRGILRMRSGNVESALQDYDRAIAADPQLAEAYLNKGLALVRGARDWDQAIALFSTALEKRARRPAFAYYGRAIAYEAEGKLKEAYLDYREASRLDPKWRDPQTELSRFSVSHR
jgi:tetratricopeptide (TPR) repeat protein